MAEAEEQARQTQGPSRRFVEPAPHVVGGALTTRRMMIDVLIALSPVLAMSVYVFRWYALKQVAVCVSSCLAAEAIFVALRCRPVSLGDCSAAVTGLILGLCMPWSCPWFVGVISSFIAISVGKVIFGGLGQNIFNPAMVGRAFATIAFPGLLGAGAYVLTNGAPLEVVTQATPMTALKTQGQVTTLWTLFVGNTNGSLGETSALACLLGGAYLLIRRTASWETPLGVLLAVLAIGGAGNLADLSAGWTVLHHLCGGALLFGAFFIATDPVTSPLTAKGKLIFGAGIGSLVMLLRAYSGYPEGVQFAVLVMNGFVPLINRWTVPRPVGGPVPAQAGK